MIRTATYRALHLTEIARNKNGSQTVLMRGLYSGTFRETSLSLHPIDHRRREDKTQTMNPYFSSQGRLYSSSNKNEIIPLVAGFAIGVGGYLAYKALKGEDFTPSSAKSAQDAYKELQKKREGHQRTSKEANDSRNVESIATNSSRSEFSQK